MKTEMKIEDLIEQAIDSSSVADVLATISRVCSLKADHIRENWQDEKLAKAWHRASSQIERVSDSPAITQLYPKSVTVSH